MFVDDVDNFYNKHIHLLFVPLLLIINNVLGMNKTNAIVFQNISPVDCHQSKENTTILGVSLQVRLYSSSWCS